MIYELLTLLKPENTPTGQEVKFVRDIVARHGGDLLKYEDEGILRLHYPLQGHEKSHRLYYIMRLPNGAGQKISAELNGYDNSLRHLLIRAEKQTQEKYEGKENRDGE